jgi:stringent starvation protein B
MATTPTTADAQGSSTRPYLIRALHDWCTDNGFTPYLAVFVDAGVRVPMEYVKNNEIVLNVGFEATSGLKLGNDFIEFKARFGGVARDIVVPIDHVIAIYARENGQGMAFPVPADGQPRVGQQPAESPDTAATGPGLRLAVPAAPSEVPPAAPNESDEPDGKGPSPASPGGARPALKRIK